MESKCNLKKTEGYKKCKIELAKIFERLLDNASNDEIVDIIEKSILKYKKVAS